ncbi:MAG: hypothetical protein JWN99_412 [Ilumatobacteraceae bacterium]|nr:hypothetical protein [Ilumatobacteraceae bacterium]
MSDAVALADEYWQYHRTTAQLWNIDRGDVDQIDHWDDLTPDGVAARIERLDDFGRRAAGTAAGDDQERTLLAALSFSADAVASLLPFDRDLTLVAGPFNIPAFLSVLVPGYSLATPAHGRGYITKIRALPAFLDGWIDGLRDGAAVGRLTTSRGLAAAVASFDSLLATPPANDPLAGQEPPGELSPAETNRWRAELVEAVADTRPAIARVLAMLRDELMPIARDDDRPGICNMPDGDRA